MLNVEYSLYYSPLRIIVHHAGLHRHWIYSLSSNSSSVWINPAGRAPLRRYVHRLHSRLVGPNRSHCRSVWRRMCGRAGYIWWIVVRACCGGNLVGASSYPISRSTGWSPRAGRRVWCSPPLVLQSSPVVIY